MNKTGRHKISFIHVSTNVQAEIGPVVVDLKRIHSVYTNIDNLQVVLKDFDNSTN